MATAVYHSKKSDEWSTPRSFISWLTKQVGAFDLDAAATSENAVCENYLTDALHQEWEGTNIWCNPPYSKINQFVEKAFDELDYSQTIHMLLPVRTGTDWWKNLHHRTLTECTFIKGRLYFGGAKSGAPFDSCFWRISLDKEDKPQYDYVTLPLEYRQ